MAAPRELDLTVTLEAAWKLWGEHLANRVAADDLSPSTRRSYVSYSRRAVDHLGPDRPIDSVEAREIQGWLASYRSRTVGGHVVGGNTMRVCHKAAKNLFAYASGERWLREDPMRDVPAPPVPARQAGAERAALARHELDAMIAAAQNGRGSFHGDRGCWKRDEIVIRLAGESGLRNADIQNLDLGDIEADPAGHWVAQIRRGKGRKARTVPLTDACAALIRDYAENARPAPFGLPDRYDCNGALTKGDAQALLLSAQRHRLNAGSVRNIVERCAKAALGRHYVPHGLRHTTGTLLAREAKADPALIAHVLGHSDISVTSVYLDTRSDEAAAAVNRRKPGARTRQIKELPPGRDDPRWPECGSKDGWLRHRREKIPKCTPCLMWKREDVQRAEVRELEKAVAQRDRILAAQSAQLQELRGQAAHRDRIIASQGARIETLTAALKAAGGLARAPRLIPVTPENQCGTPRGYKRHRRAGTEPCGACLDAVAAYTRENEALKGPARPKAFCPVCGELRSVAMSGGMRKHGSCTGAGQFPIEAEVRTAVRSA